MATMGSTRSAVVALRGDGAELFRNHYEQLETPGYRATDPAHCARCNP